jgi:hypothetical protein
VRWKAVKLALGDTAYIYAPGHKGELTPAKVVHIFDYGTTGDTTHYVVEIETHIDPILYVRDVYLRLGQSIDKPIGLWRKRLSVRRR